ncbi:hypothetical protein [Pirellula sp. SH-Sr6A]|uniref:hypothetical protein n=1 Tax=Pirellula sp. SH-Sr6A TaxID=1632865 RepID=UPI0011BAD92E|nr:hypothetical protein [Pirellula sp. SH-Sr6A]
MISHHQLPESVSESSRTIVVSYLSIRRGIGYIGLLLPLLLGPVGQLMGIQIQDNMSSYYHTVLRDVFVGSMCAIGVFLFCYRGYDWIETWTGRMGSFFALGVALCPLDANSDPMFQRTIVGYAHTVFGGGFFLTLAFYSLYHFPVEPEDGPQQGLSPVDYERNLVYRLSGGVILIALLTMGAYLFLLPLDWRAWLNDYNFLFWTEWIAVWAFAAAWLTKGRAIFTSIVLDILSTSRVFAGH